MVKKYSKTSDPSSQKGANSGQPTGTLKRAGSFFKLVTSVAQAELMSRIKNGTSGGDTTQSTTAVRLIQATALVRELGHLKGAAMKIGQMLALEARDYLPDEVIQVLEQLQNKVSFMPFTTVSEIIKNDLGEKADLLVNLSQEPIAAASIGQVHRAEFNGEPVAVKIQYPGIRDSIRSDIKILGSAMKGLVTLFRRDFDLDGILDEFAEVFIQETDYIQEAAAAAEYHKAAAQLKNVIVPRVFPTVCTPHILTMSYEPGSTLTQWIRENRSNVEVKRQLGVTILELYTHEFCEWGLVQTDPNPGNFLVRSNTHELVLLDFGATKRYSLNFRRCYSKLVMAIFNKDRQRVREISISMGLVSAQESEAAFLIFEELVFESIRPLTLKSFNFNDTGYVAQVQKLSRKLVLELKYSPPPRDLIFLHRKLGGIFQMLRQLEIEIELGAFLEPFEKLAKES